MSTRHLYKGLAAFGFFTAVALSSPVSAANVDVDLRGGMYMDSDAPALGGGLLMNVGDETGWYFNPNVEFAFRDNDTNTALSGDFHYDIPTNSSVSPYLGAGPTLLMNDGDTDFGVNVLGGVSGRGEVRPFGQLKAIIGGNDNQVALMGGVRF